jgi:sugar O-acyltransferase (sialic acid O-acetyltransferase NeuD family)
MKKPVILIGYSGHGLVVADILLRSGQVIAGYCDMNEKSYNPFGIDYLGSEDDMFENNPDCLFFVAIGDNRIRRRVQEKLQSKGFESANAIHPSAVIGADVHLGKGVLICPQVVINPAARIADGVILNTGSIVEHECQIADFCHIAPGAVLCGNVSVAQDTFVGARSVVIQGLTIGAGVTIAAGSVVISDIEAGARVAGVPAKQLTT